MVGPTSVMITLAKLGFQSYIFVSSHMTRTSFWQKIKKGSPLIAGFKELFIRVNHKNELYFSISFQNGVNRVYIL